MKSGAGNFVGVRFHYLPLQHNIEPVTEVLNKYTFIDYMSGTSYPFYLLNIFLVRQTPF